MRLVGAQLLEQQEEWQLERRRFFSEATMAKIPEPEEPLELTDDDAADMPAAAIYDPLVIRRLQRQRDRRRQARLDAMAEETTTSTASTGEDK